jgi:hypothetical protein
VSLANPLNLTAPYEHLLVLVRQQNQGEHKALRTVGVNCTERSGE